ncbi:MAG: SRPBCC family protein [Promethearchaeota archaeon]|jgi:uncharacterized protein YndB with AHSA1/START domain
METIIQLKEEVNCDLNTAFDMFTQNNLLESWLTVKAEVEPRVGGKYELFWQPENRENNSTIGCKVTGIDQNFLSFDWKGPTEFQSFMNIANPLTHVIVFFSHKGINPNITLINLFHTGWKSDPEWKQARDYFEKAWSNALGELKDKIKNKSIP